MELSIVPSLRSLVRENSSYVAPYAPPASTQRGLMSLGDGGFSGSANHFSGSALGTGLALNFVTGYAGDLFNFQLAGVGRVRGVLVAGGADVRVGTLATGYETRLAGNANGCSWESYSAGTGWPGLASATGISITPIIGATLTDNAVDLGRESTRFRALYCYSLDLKDGNCVLSATTGTKWGTATTQKQSWFNAVPVVQALAVADAAGGATIDAEARTALNALLARMRTYGLIAT